jgi:lipopolysaccharide/colanic/teichoic acid biosynthesis glycosyltransferase
MNHYVLKGSTNFEQYDFTPDSHAYLNSWLKRLLDIVGSLIGIFIGFPIFLGAACIVRLIDRVPILFTQERFGLDGEGFTFYKLRTLKIIETRDMVDRSRIESKPIYETTCTGRFWRTSSIDEIVQFWLVLKGEMSLIGHRPFPMYYLPHLDKISDINTDKLYYYLSIIKQYKPGMSSLSSVNGRGDLTMQQKIEYDLIYAQNASFYYDLKLLFQTLIVVVTQKGAK